MSRQLRERFFWPVATLLATAFAASFTSVSYAEEGKWPFEPTEDTFTGDALLDLRFLNEKESGESGFVRLSRDGDDFVRGDGEPIRFWAIGSGIYTRTGEEMDQHCRFLAKIGVNMVRLHANIANTKKGAAITDVNEKQIEGILRFIKAAKQNGIYLTISPYYGHHKTPKSWGLEGYAEDQYPWGAIFVSPKMQDAYKVWTRELYTRKNPHTGLAIKDDPTVAILQVHNEDSMFFWTSQDLPEPQLARLEKRFGAWLTKKYGSIGAAFAAWGGKPKEGDDLASGRVEQLTVWYMTQDWEGSAAKRLRDQTQFWAEHQYNFYAEMGRYLREDLGCKQLLNATNWRTADDSRLKDIERLTYSALEIDAENEYYGSDYQHIGENKGYRIDPGHYLVNESCLHKPLELTTNYKMHDGHPFIVTETSWKHPNLYQSEGPFLIAAYQSLNGLDAVFWFSASEPTWHLDPRRTWWWVNGLHPLHKWTCSVPPMQGMFPANALLYRKGYLKQGDVIVHEVRTPDELFSRQLPVIDDNEIYGVGDAGQELKRVQAANGQVSRAAFLVGRVEWEIGDDPRKTKVVDFSRHLDGSNNTINSNTGELAFNYDVGLCRVDAPKAQGICGFLKDGGGRYRMSDVIIESENDYAAVSVVAMDDLPLKRSKKILVQVGTTARLTGWEVKDAEVPFKKKTIDGKQIVNTGKPPWQIADTKVHLHVNNPNLTKATLLDVSGYPAEELELKRAGSAASIDLPANAMYVVLQE